MEMTDLHKRLDREMLEALVEVQERLEFPKIQDYPEKLN